MLLNTALTYENKNTKQQHIKAWKLFINTIINKLLSRNKKLVIFLWGADANKLNPLTLAKQNNQLSKYNNIKILRASHPSNNYNACNKRIFNGKIESFKECNHFEMCNKFLGKGDAVNWQDI